MTRIQPPSYAEIARRLSGEPRTWLVTGSAGFIGSHLVEELLRLGQRVRGVDNLSSGTMENLADVEMLVGPGNWSRYEHRTADLCSPGVGEEVCRGIDCVLHQAAATSATERSEDLLETHRVNVDAFFRLLVAARGAGVRRVVYASSGSVYGNAPFGPRREVEGVHPASWEAATKVICETYAAAFHRCFGLPTTGLRYFNVFGPRQSARGAGALIPAWIPILEAGGDVELEEDGGIGRDFCFVRNIVRASILGAMADDQGGCGRRFNIGSGQRTTLLQLYGRVRSLVQARCPSLLLGDAVAAGPGPAALTRSFPDLRLAHWLLGYEPVERIDAGLEETCAWYASQPGEPAHAMALGGAA